MNEYTKKLIVIWLIVAFKCYIKGNNKPNNTKQADESIKLFSLM